MLGKGTIVAIVVFGVCCCLADAAILVEDAKGWKINAPDWAVSLGASVDVHSEGGPDVLLLEIDKNFTGSPDEYGIFPSITLVFDQVAPDGETATKIVILDESATNNTTVDWDDYHFKLFTYGLASFNREETFPSDYGLSGDDFSIAPFTQYEWQPDVYIAGPGIVEHLELFGGTVLKGDQFSPGGGPNGGELVIDVDLSGDDAAHFGFKEIPTPEPGTLVLLTIGAAAIALRKRTT